MIWSSGKVSTTAVGVFRLPNIFLNVSPMEIIETMIPYFARMASCTSRCALPVTTSAVADTTGAFGLILPRTLHACIVTAELLRILLTLPDVASVVKPARPSRKGAIHTGLATASPDLRKVTSETYFSDEIDMVPRLGVDSDAVFSGPVFQCRAVQ